MREKQFIKSAGEEYQFVKREGNIVAVGKIITWKNGKQCHLPFNIEAVGKNIKWGRWKEDGNFGEENQDKKK